jgi:serine/threonine protein kinase/tetratricopeptide (TPR) repeat protein
LPISDTSICLGAEWEQENKSRGLENRTKSALAVGLAEHGANSRGRHAVRAQKQVSAFGVNQDRDARCKGAGQNDRVSSESPTTASENVLAESSDQSPDKRAEVHAYRRGANLDRYIVLDQLGEGGMGLVLRALDPDLNRRVAIKVLRPTPQMTRDPLALERAQTRSLREGKALARLSHPHVLPVYDVGKINATIFLAMHYVAGRTLDVWARERTRTWREVFEVMMQVGEGLAAAHRAGMVHRDFKPQNVMIEGDAHAWVMDFGLVRWLESASFDAGDRHGVQERQKRGVFASAAFTAVGTVLGTPLYMAPEQHEGIAADARADVYAYCLTFLEMLGYRLPFCHVPLSDLAAEKRHFTAPRGLKRVPRWLLAILARGLTPDPALRPEDLVELCELLASGRRNHGLRHFAALGATALVVGLFLAGSSTSDGSDPFLRCIEPAAELGRAWTVDAQRRIVDSFERTGHRQASAIAPLVLQRLDNYRTQWQAAYEQACKAAHGEGEGLSFRRATHFDRARLCLRERGLVWLAWLDVLAHADANRVERAEVSLLNLPAPDECNQRDFFLPQLEVPTDERERQVVENFRRTLAEISAIFELGEFERGTEEARALAAQLRGVSFVPLHAEVLSRLGHLHMAAGDCERAREILKKSTVIATAMSMPDLALLNLTSLVYTVGYCENRSDLARDWSRDARALVLASSNQDYARSLLLLNEGTLRGREGDLEGSYWLTEEALRLREKVLGPSSRRLVVPLANLGALAQALDRPDEAIAHLRRAAYLGERTMSAMHPYLALVWFNMGLILTRDPLAPDYDGGYQAMERALSIWQQNASKSDIYIKFTKVEMAVIRTQQGRFDEAVSLLRDVVEVEEKGGSHGADMRELQVRLDECIRLLPLEWRAGLMGKGQTRD